MPRRRRERIVYFPSCAARNMGPARGQDHLDSLPTATERVLRKAGLEPIYPAGLTGLCCGQPFESKGLMDAADRKSRGAGGRAARGQRRR